MRTAITSASLAALIAGLAPATAHAATALGNMTAGATLGITTPVGVDIGDFTNILPDEEINTSGSGLGTTSTVTTKNALFGLETFADATAGPETGSADAARSNEGVFTVTNDTVESQTITFNLDWSLDGEATLTNASLDSASAFGTVGLGEGQTGSSLFFEELSLAGLEGGNSQVASDDWSLDFDLRAGETATFNLSTFSEAEAASVIPLPAGLPLLLAGLGALALLRRARRS